MDKAKNLHPRSKHNSNYDFNALILVQPELKNYVSKNNFGTDSIDFANPKAVKVLNIALLKANYNIKFYELPDTNLCPPIPGRAEYVHYMADVLSESINGTLPTGSGIKVLDIGVGANCIYPIIGNAEYGWTFVGSENDKPAENTAKQIVNNNLNLRDKISIRNQPNKRNIFKNIILQDEKFDFTMCNPPFHNSKEKATEATNRKLKNLGKPVTEKPVLNFSGQNNELWYEGGEVDFITNMIYESVHYKNNVKFFSTLVSKKDHLKPLFTVLKKVAASHRIVDMQQGNKMSRVLVWKFD
jgi:23S rRNA (adenine1618-N6)-methyltransferase